MRFASRFSAGFYGGAALSSLVPQVYPVSLNGRGYMVDLSRDILRNGFREQSVSLLRNQADQSAVPSEASINPEDLWRRAAESWHHGAGQTNLDRPESDSWRFRSSKGMDVWTRYRLTALNDTTTRRSTSATTMQVLPVGTYLYVIDGTEVYWTQDVTVAPTWTAAAIQNGEGAQSVKSIASDGKTVYAALGSNGIHTTSRGATTAIHYSDLAATLVAYVKGQLMAANGNTIYNVIASGAAPSALLSHPNSDFTWVGFAAGPSAIYAAGYSGDKSLIYRTAVKADGTMLDVPIVAGELPDGEIVRAVQGYLGNLVVGSDKGVRLAAIDSNGDLTLGALIPTPAAVQCFEPQDRFVWYGLTNYDSVSTGLGRLDLSTFTEALTPAYASDLMVTTQGAVLSVATFQNLRVFGISGYGYCAETTNKVASATLDSGHITYGLSDVKVAMSLDVAHEPLYYGTHKAYVSPDSATFRLVGQHSVGDPEGTFFVGQMSASTFEVRIELDRDGTDATQAPTVTRWTLRSAPTPLRSITFTVPLLIYEQIKGLDEADHDFDVQAAYDDIKSLTKTGTLTSFQIGPDSYSVFVTDYDFMRQKVTEDGKSWQGHCTVALKAPTV